MESPIEFKTWSAQQVAETTARYASNFPRQASVDLDNDEAATILTVHARVETIDETGETLHIRLEPATAGGRVVVNLFDGVLWDGDDETDGINADEVASIVRSAFGEGAAAGRGRVVTYDTLDNLLRERGL